MGTIPTSKQSASTLTGKPDSQPVPSARVHTVCTGTLRKGKRTKELVKRVKQGEIALIDHLDLDAMAAQGLLACRPCAVLDASSPISGRYPNRGPSLLAAAKVPLYALNDPGLFDILSDGTPLSIRSDGALIYGGETYPDAVELWTADRIQAALNDARGNLTTEIQHFADNTLSFVKSEAVTLLEPNALPPLVGVPNIEKRHVVIVVRGEGYREDLESISGYLADVNPVIIGVDGGADALIEAGRKPHIIIGDMDSVSDRALKCGACLVVHAYATTGDAPGVERLTELGLTPEIFKVPGTSEDAAMLLAYEKGAELIVAVGTHSNLEDFLDKGRAGMASTFLTRLKVGSRLVDARGVSRLHGPKVGGGIFAALALCAAFPLVAAISFSPRFSEMRSVSHLYWRIWMVNLEHLSRHWGFH